MEAIAHGQESDRFDIMLTEGQSYDFLRVGFAPTNRGPLRQTFRICSEHYVVLDLHTVINIPPRTVWIAVCPLRFMEFEEVYGHKENMFAGTSHSIFILNIMVYNILA